MVGAALLLSSVSARAEFDKFDFQKPFAEKKAQPAAKRGKKEPGRAYTGKLGFRLPLPGKKASGLTARGSLEEGREVVYLLPPGVELGKAREAEPGDYAALGLIKLDVLKIEELEPAERKNPLKAMRDRIQEGAELAGEKSTEEPLASPAGKAFRVDVEGKNARTHAVVVGERLVFSFMSGRMDGRLKSILRGLRENP